MTGFIDQSPTKRVLDEHFLPAASTPNVRSDTEQIAASVQPDAAFSYSYICHSPYLLLRSLQELNYYDYEHQIHPKRGLFHFKPNHTYRKTKPLGKYGMLRKSYLKQHLKRLYICLVLEDSLHDYLYEIDEEAYLFVFGCVKEMAAQEGVDEALKAKDQAVKTRQWQYIWKNRCPTG